MKLTRGWTTQLLAVGGAGLIIGGAATMASGVLGGAVGFDSAEPGSYASHYEISVEGIPFTNTDFVAITPITSSTQPGGTLYDPVRLVRRYSAPDELSEWWRRIAASQRPEPRDVKITYYDDQLQPFFSVTLEQAWPSGWESPGIQPGRSQEAAPPEESIKLTFLNARYH